MSTFRALMIADMHMSNKLPYARPTRNGLTDRFEDQLLLWNYVRKTAESNEVDAIFILGDLFDRSLLDAVTLTHTVEEIQKCPCKVFLLPGNHDMGNSTKSSRSLVEVFNQLRNDDIQVIGEDFLDVVSLYLGDGVHLDLWPIAYANNEKTRESLDKIKKAMPAARMHVALMHHSFLGAEAYGWICDDGIEPDEVCDQFDFVFSGHFHKTQEFGSKGNGMYLGSPMQHDFGDVNKDSGFWLVDFCSSGEIKQEFVETKFMPKFRKYKTIFTQYKYDRGDYLRFIIRETESEFDILKPKLKVVLDELNQKGVKADYKFLPIYKHEHRLGETTTDELPLLSLGRAVKRYVGLASVKKDGLDQKILKKIGKEALIKAKSKRERLEKI